MLSHGALVTIQLHWCIVYFIHEPRVSAYPQAQQGDHETKDMRSSVLLYRFVAGQAKLNLRSTPLGLLLLTLEHKHQIKDLAVKNGDIFSLVPFSYGLVNSSGTRI